MNIFDAEKFYRKWISDISDCQDTISGHVQYTAPYVLSGGGPGGWDCAIVEVPYQFYKHYGDAAPLRETYDQMLKYFDFLESCSENDLVVTSRPGIWCLGDWLPPIPPIISTPFINNYFYIKSMKRTIEIAKIIGREEDIPMFEQRIEERKKAMISTYFDKYNGNFFGGAHGANAFAVDIGIGDHRTYPAMVEMYRKHCAFNAGIFGTDVLTKVLFENGDGDLATKLLISEEDHTFARMKALGATSIWESWPHSYRDRSHDHPMFGAVTAYLFDYILGITQPDYSAGYSSLVISPCIPEDLAFAEGSRVLPSGEVSVRWEKYDDKVRFSVTVPDNVPSVFRYKDTEMVLSPGANELTL